MATHCDRTTSERKHGRTDSRLFPEGISNAKTSVKHEGGFQKSDTTLTQHVISHPIDVDDRGSAGRVIKINAGSNAEPQLI